MTIRRPPARIAPPAHRRSPALFGSRAGLGRLISQSADSFNMPELFAGAVILAVAGIAMTAGFGRLERRLVPWTRFGIP
jgi:ABC-type nitrate/sulfonate/bicarbonate transport system permease component